MTTPYADTQRQYTQYARVWFPAHSPLYAEWAEGVAASPELLERIGSLPTSKQQPNLVFAAARFCGCPDAGFEEFKAFALQRWDAIAAEARSRMTQTNESARCATLLPVFEHIQRQSGQPLALIELGPSAGLCLVPDRYAYQYDDGEVLGAENLTAGAPLLPCTTRGGVPLPTRLPEIASRVGVDLNPLDAADPATRRWLECLVWPGQTRRLERLRAGLDVVASLDGLELVRGDLMDQLERLVSRVPAGQTPVVYHSAVIAYLPPDLRERFTELVTSLPCRWVANEGFFMSAATDADIAVPREREGVFTLALDGVPLAHTHQHGAEIDWVADGFSAGSWPEDGQYI
ncbi:DUF2332 domain-containing protein [Zhihengliuella flava]|uniref:DUF2332 domain-containing protein n=1 Tax=Zhihengliuella flava TaxID=1285193 RepID=A0A931DC61_9MICC|nr:DUF2332 domain-containing protein [Zhihengliuella flava]MBG6084173.1 hypothetical protein [Zhihengliuella flava]